MPAKKEPEQKKLSQSQVKALGFTARLIEELLPPPELKQNPRYRSAAKMKLWNEGDVEKAMETEAFKQALVEREKRAESARKAVETKRSKTMRQIEKAIAEIEVVGGWSKRSLEKECCRARDEWLVYQRNRFAEDPSCMADEETIARWMVNFVRHELTVYDASLYSLKGCVGVDEAYLAYKEAVLNEIGRTYPFLMKECERQKQKARGECRMLGR